MTTKDCLVLMGLLLLLGEMLCEPLKRGEAASIIDDIGGTNRIKKSRGSNNIGEPDSVSVDVTERNVVDRDTHSLGENSQFIDTHKLPLQTGRELRRNKRAFGEPEWDNGIIPYKISPSFSDEHAERIEWVMAKISKLTCIKFGAPKSKETMVEIVKGEGCHAELSDDTATLTLGDGCMERSTILHELLHIIGFYHEHTRPDRNRYITVNWENIENNPELRSNFDIVKDGKTYGRYDYFSIMHYVDREFQKSPDLKTITTKDKKYQKLIGNVEAWSFEDIAAVNVMYKCAGKCGTIRCAKNAFLDKNCECRCKRANSFDPTEVCPHEMEFGFKRTGKTTVNRGRNPRLLCASPFCTDYQIFKLNLDYTQFSGSTPLASCSVQNSSDIDFLSLRMVLSKVTTSDIETTPSAVYYNHRAPSKYVVFGFVMRNIQCSDAGTYVCSCLSGKRGTRASTTWMMKVNGAVDVTIVNCHRSLDPPRICSVSKDLTLYPRGLWLLDVTH